MARTRAEKEGNFLEEKSIIGLPSKTLAQFLALDFILYSQKLKTRAQNFKSNVTVGSRGTSSSQMLIIMSSHRRRWYVDPR